MGDVTKKKKKKKQHRDGKYSTVALVGWILDRTPTVPIVPINGPLSQEMSPLVRKQTEEKDWAGGQLSIEHI